MMNFMPPMLRAIAMACLVTMLAPVPPVRAQAALPEEGYGPAAAAARAGDWDLAYALVDGLGPVARDLVTWDRLRSGAGTFADHAAFLDRRPDWPGQDRLLQEAERAIPEDADPVAVIAFFGAEPPRTGEGARQLAAALSATGQPARAEAVVTTAWLELGLDEAGHAALLSAFPETLAPLHAARADAMLWRWRTTDAARLLPLLAEDQRALAQARIALLRGDGDAAARIAAVPEALRDDPGLAHDRFNRLAIDGNYTEASELLLSRSGTAEDLGQPLRWASWRATLARWTMREGRAQAAYDMTVAHHLQDGVLYADLEWLAGYIALTYLNDPVTAARHFARLEAAVSGPISMSRAGYWAGRAAEAQGEGLAAAEAYARAARHQTAFYGLLAGERLGLPLDPTLAAAADVPDWTAAPFLTDDLTKAFLLLMDAGDRGAAVLFAAELAGRLDRTGLTQFGAMLAAMEEPFFIVLVGKAAAARGIVIPEIYYPLHPLAEMDLPVAPELALSIARRESEFNHGIASPVGALGLMQVMPGTAQDVARGLGLPYSRGRLTSDWRYNATLGAAYLATLSEMFGDSPVLIAAGYNAGPGRPRTWITQRGDPRRGEMDVVDWIEHIPFTETRDYVMRVTESIPVYRARLTGAAGENRFTELLVGAPPLVRPQARPEAGGDGTGPALQSTLRPVARPAGQGPE